jgi:hypothetical protein
VDARDLIVTPVLLMVVYFCAYLVRSRVPDRESRAYFMPALTVRIVGALFVGFIYQYYYEGGDTLAYHTHGSRHIWEAFMTNPMYGLELLFSNGVHQPETFAWSHKIWYFRDQQSFFVIRLAAVFDLLTFSSYSGTAVLFAVVSFIGAWLMYRTFYRMYPTFHRWLAVACLFVPSVFFWGSGIFKDTITLAALGIATYCVYQIAIEKRIRVGYILAIAICFWIIYSIKIYILLCFLPAALLWIGIRHIASVRQVVARVLLLPVGLACIAALGYLAVWQVAAEDPRYNLSQIAETARVTAYDIGFWTGKDAGSRYSLGELDGTLGGMLRLAPQAINVSLYRPYLWEVNNPLMLLAALESFVLLVMTLYVLARARTRTFRYLFHPDVVFCMVFALIFAFAVGVSTYNFGTLSRYKIPLMPFFLVGIGLIYYYSNKERKVEVLEETEYRSITV